MDIAIILGNIRREKKLKQLWMASKLEVSDLTLSRYERGKRKMPLKFAQEYADMMGYSLTLIRNG
jgi:DNA-binding XRE family transcriptional regulator